MQPFPVHRQRALQLFHGKSCRIFLQAGMTDAYAQLITVGVERVDAAVQLAHGKEVVVAQCAVLPVHLSEGITTQAQVYVTVCDACLPHRGLDMCGGVGEEGGRVDDNGDARAVEVEAVETYAPSDTRGVYRSSVAHVYGQVAVSQCGAGQFHLHRVQVDAWRRESELSDSPLQAHVAYEVGGVHLRVVQLKCVYHHLVLQQWPKLHVDHCTPDVGNGVSLVHDAHAVHSQIQGKVEVHMLHRDLHPRSFRGISRHSLRHPILYGGHIEQCCQDEYQQDGAQQHNPRPLQRLLHRRCKDSINRAKCKEKSQFFILF